MLGFVTKGTGRSHAGPCCLWSPSKTRQYQLVIDHQVNKFGCFSIISYHKTFSTNVNKKREDRLD